MKINIKRDYLFVSLFAFLSLFTPPATSNASPGDYGVCTLLPSGDAICEAISQTTEEIKGLRTQEKAITGDDEPAKTQRAEIQAQIKTLQDKQNTNMINALSKYDRTGGFKVAEGLQVGSEGDLSLIESQEGTWIPSRVITLMAKIIGTFAILILAFGGLLMITSEGDENRLQNGKNIFFYTIIGLLVAFMSYIGVQFIISVLFTTGGA